MKKKIIIGIVILCLVVAGVITGIVIRNNKNAAKSDEAIAEQTKENQNLKEDDSSDESDQNQSQAYIVTDDGSQEKYYTFYQVKEPSDMFPNGQDDYEVQKWGEYQKYWDDFSVYGTYDQVDAPPTGETGYNEDYLVEKTTDKGAKCIVDTRTGKVYYHNMILPTGIRYPAGKETNSMAGHYIEAHEDQCPKGQYSFTYEMMQDCYGYPVD
jgi:hypothetical protein